MSEQRIFSKCARRLIPFMALLYFVNFLDRTNVAFAGLTMNADLGFSPSTFGFGAGIFFVGYALFQVPANLILERLGTRRWVFCILAAWGLLSASNALVQGPLSFYALRFFLGVAEAGFFPGMLLYLTYWFPQACLPRFTANFMVAIPLSFVLGGPLASLILQLNGIAGLHGWQWLFLLEGLPASLLAFVTLRVLPDRPTSAAWLTSEEKTAITERLAAESPVGTGDLRTGLLDPRTFVLGLANFAFQVGAYGVGLWLPQIVRGMGFSNVATGFIVAVPFMAGAAGMIVWGRSSYQKRERIWHAALPWLVSALACATASVFQSNVIVLAALGLAVIGLYSAQGPFFSLPSSFLRGSAAAGGIAFFNMFGNLGAFVGPTIVGILTDRTGDYAAGMAALAIGFGVAALIILALRSAISTPIVVANITKVS